MKKILFCLTLFSLTLFGCSEWDDEFEFRNYLRDKHPYSEITRMELHAWTYLVQDTLKGQTWVYSTYRSKKTTKKHQLK